MRIVQKLLASLMLKYNVLFGTDVFFLPLVRLIQPLEFNLNDSVIFIHVMNKQDSLTGGFYITNAFSIPYRISFCIINAFTATQLHVFDNTSNFYSQIIFKRVLAKQRILQTSTFIQNIREVRVALTVLKRPICGLIASHNDELFGVKVQLQATVISIPL